MAQTTVYTWGYAQPGDAADPVTCVVNAEQLALYRALFPQGEGAGTRPQDFVPVVFVRLFAPLRRHEVVLKRGAAYPPYPTPAVKWHCTMLQPVRVGERIVSVTRVHEKFIRRDRHFLEWRVDARREDGMPVAEFSYINLWDQGRPEDKTR